MLGWGCWNVRQGPLGVGVGGVSNIQGGVSSALSVDCPERVRRWSHNDDRTEHLTQNECADTTRHDTTRFAVVSRGKVRTTIYTVGSFIPLNIWDPSLSQCKAGLFTGRVKPHGLVRVGQGRVGEA